MPQNKIIPEIKNILTNKKFVTVAIDGRCGSGKTTLATKLEKSLCCNVIHMDDFFLRPEQRTKERLETPGGNVDYERFLDEVLIPLKRNEAFSYRPFDCRGMSLKEPVEVIQNSVTIIEGSYSCHPNLWEYYDLHIFLDVSKEEQARRILSRNGDKAKHFFERWIPLEEKYFKTYKIKEKCEIKALF